MGFLNERVLDLEARFMRRLGYLRAGLKVAPLLREAMAERGLTAKELAVEIAQWARLDPENRKPLDWRTIKHAMEGSCELDSYLMIAGFFGWPFAEAVHTPVIGADPIASEEQELARMLTAAAAVNSRLERRRLARAGLDEVAPQTAVRSVHEDRQPRAFDDHGPRSAA